MTLTTFDLFLADLFLAAAFLLTVLASFGVTTRVHLGWLGVAVFFLGLLLK